MAAIDYASIPESTRQSLLAATYKLAQELFQDPEVQADYEIWLAKRKEARPQNERRNYEAPKKMPLPDVPDRKAAYKGE